jgi:hypothetical protein
MAQAHALILVRSSIRLEQGIEHGHETRLYNMVALPEMRIPASRESGAIYMRVRPES